MYIRTDTDTHAHAHTHTEMVVLSLTDTHSPAITQQEGNLDRVATGVL